MINVISLFVLDGAMFVKAAENYEEWMKLKSIDLCWRISMTDKCAGEI